MLVTIPAGREDKQTILKGALHVHYLPVHQQLRPPLYIVTGNADGGMLIGVRRQDNLNTEQVGYRITQASQFVCRSQALRQSKLRQKPPQRMARITFEGCKFTAQAITVWSRWQALNGAGGSAHLLIEIRQRLAVGLRMRRIGKVSQHV